MLWSKLFIPTLREDPAEAEVASHKLLLRAGYIRQLSAGIYSYLFLAQRSLLKIQRIVREEMDAIGAQEIFLPALHPAELWQESGRWDIMGDNMFRLKDRFQRDLCLGMTHEEVVTAIARGELRSYKQLPQIWYQIQTKFRDEARPKSGLMRVRQFIMKDSYTFDMDQAGLDAAYEKHYRAYCRIFERCGLVYSVVEAHSGAMGGSQSHEYMVASEAGEDLVAVCPGCGYAANLEKAAAVPAKPAIADPEGDFEPEEFHTPGRKTIAEVAEFTGLPETSQMKSLVLVADGKPVLVMLRGDHQLSETKLGAIVNDPEFRPAASRRNPAVVRRGSGIAGAGGREQHADSGGPGAGGPAQHDRGREQRRLPPAPRDPGRRFSGGDSRSAPGGRGRPVRQVRRRARYPQDGRDRPHFQAGVQVLGLDGAARAERRRQGSDAHHGIVRHRHRAHSERRHRAVSTTRTAWFCRSRSRPSRW